MRLHGEIFIIWDIRHIELETEATIDCNIVVSAHSGIRIKLNFRFQPVTGRDS